MMDMIRVFRIRTFNILATVLRPMENVMLRAMLYEKSILDQALWHKEFMVLQFYSPSSLMLQIM